MSFVVFLCSNWNGTVRLWQVNVHPCRLSLVVRSIRTHTHTHTTLIKYFILIARQLTLASPVFFLLHVENFLPQHTGPDIGHL